MSGDDQLRERLASALLGEGHSLRFGADGYVLDRALAVVREYADQRAAEELVVLAARLVEHDIEDMLVYDEIGTLRAALGRP